METYLESEVFHSCYRPQSLLRLVFQGYATFSAFIIYLLTSSLACNMSDTAVETAARFAINTGYFVFGPVLLIFVNYGFMHFKGLAFVCSPRGTTHHLNFTDIILLLGSLILSLCATFTMAM